MRAVGLATWLVVSGCSFRGPAGNTPGADAADDGPADGPADGPKIDGPIDAPPSLARRKLITIDPARVTGNQAAFPVWIVLAADNDLKARAAPNGADIHFRRADGTLLEHQLQRWDKASGRLEAWVRADLDDTLQTVIELRYGDPGIVHPPDASAVFSSSFLAVWHLDDQLNNATIAEAKNLRTGTTAGGLGPNDQVTAQLGGGVDFDGNDDRITFANPFAGGGDHTISAWVNQGTANGIDSIVTVGTDQGGQSRWFHSHYGSGMRAGFYGPDWDTVADPLPDIQNDGWVLVHWVFKNANRQSSIYVNGAKVGDHTFSTVNPIDTQGTGGYLGYAPNPWGPGGSSPAAMNGILDEVRLSSAERNAGWIATEYANQSAPLTFYAVGSEQMVP